MVEVDDKAALLAGGVCVAVNTDARGSSKLGADVLVEQLHGIIAGRSSLMQMAETRRVGIAGCGKEGNVDKIARPGTTEPGM